jgi:hypothetical protein
MVALAARYALPAIYPVREFAAYLQRVAQQGFNPSFSLPPNSGKMQQ